MNREPWFPSRPSINEREARRRVGDACSLIRSAYRLESLDPKETLLSVRTAIAWGADQQAADVAEAANSYSQDKEVS